MANRNIIKESEKTLDRKLGRAIKAKKGLYIKLNTMHLLGLPDRLCLLPGGLCFFAEIKTTGDKPRKIQKFMHRKLEKLGFKVFIIDETKKIYESLHCNKRSPLH